MRALTEEQVRRDIGQLEANLDVRKTKYIRNYNRYVNNGTLKDQIDSIEDNPPQGFWWNSAEPDTGPIPMLNVLRSMIDTVCSKLSQTKVRPFFNPINGDWETRKVCRQALHFFDLYFGKQQLFRKAILARRDSLIFEVGYIWIDDDSGNVERIMPWDFLFDRAELHYRRLTRCAVRRESYPLGMLDGAEWLNKQWKGELERNRVQKIKLVIYYDLTGGKKSYWINGSFVAERPIEFSCSPVVWSYYSDPIKGAFTTSLVDNQYTSQALIDIVAERIELSVELSPASIILLPKGSNLRRSSFTNETGGVYEYQPQPFVQAIPQFLTPSPISGEYLEILKYVMEMAYNLEGVSQLSAQSVKPSGINSGVALQTLQNVESERFQMLVDEHTDFLMRITETVIDVLPPDARVLPDLPVRGAVKWRDVKRERASFSVQFAPVSALSKDPQTKMQQIEKLIGMKVIPPEAAPQYLEFPDVEKESAASTAIEDVIEHVIERAIEEGVYDYDLIVPGAQLEQAVMREIYRLDAIDEKEDVMRRAREFYGVVVRNNLAMAKTQAPPLAPPQLPPSPVPAPAVPIGTKPVPGQPSLPVQAPQSPAGQSPSAPPAPAA